MKEAYQSLEELRKDYESDEEEKPKHKLRKISEHVFTSIAFPMLSQARNAENCMNKLPVPEINKWDALVKALSVPGGILRHKNCTGQCLHELAFQVEWKPAPPGRSKKNALSGWACTPTTGWRASNSGALGYNLGEAVVNLWMKMQIEEVTPVKKRKEATGAETCPSSGAKTTRKKQKKQQQ